MEWSRKTILLQGVCLAFVCLYGCAGAPRPAGTTAVVSWTSLDSLPAPGVSAPFAGEHGGKFLVAGGCNFPDVPAAQAGEKKYYAAVYALDTAIAPGATWIYAGELPEAVAYGASVTLPEGVVCIGGNGAARAFDAVFLLQWSDSAGRAVVEPLPSLPVTLDNAAAAALGRTVYVAGGNENGSPSNAVYCLDMDRRADGWKTLPPFPGAPRVQPVSVVQRTPGGRAFFLAGGFCPARGDSASVVATDVWAYYPEASAWQRVTSILPFADGALRTLTGGCGVAYGDSSLLFAGGVNYSIFREALDRNLRIAEAEEKGDRALAVRLAEEGKNYLLHPVAWYRFNTSLLLYNTYTGAWKNLGDYEQTARAGAAALLHGDRLVLVNGELMPGIRTPQVNQAQLPF